MPTPAELPGRLDAVLRVIYLVFNEGYEASSGDSSRGTISPAEAIRLGRLLVELLPEPEVLGLLALMLLHESRREARTSPAGELVRLDEQDRSLWDRALIAEGTRLVRRALLSRRFGSYTIQAAISAVHAEAPDSGATDWDEIVGLYDVPCCSTDPSPIVELNRAVAVAMRDGPEAGSGIIDADSRPRRSTRLPAGARRARGLVPAPRTGDRCAHIVRAGDRLDEAGAGAALSRTAVGAVADASTYAFRLKGKLQIGFEPP